MNRQILRTAAFSAVMVPAAAYAHTGMHPTGGFSAGLTHPFLGLDHVLAMVLVGAWAGMQRRAAMLALPAAFLALMAVGAGAAGAINMWYDRDIDAVMRRTARRPIPAGRIAPQEGLAFGLVLSLFAVMTMGLAVNWTAAGLLAGANAFYVLVYTMWLKRRTPQNIVIGGAAGAFPPMIGWAAVTGGVSVDSLVLFALIFLWTPPHFWALSLYTDADYSRSSVRR